MNRKVLALALGVVSLIGLAAIAAQAGAKKPKAKAEITSIKDARKIYIRRLTGDDYFASRLVKEMRGMGLQFVSDKASADAIFTAHGEYDDGAFYGQMKFFNRAGKLLWKARATRPRGSNYMAYSRLADQLRRALRD